VKIFNDLAEWQRFRQALASEVSLGFVPTMGNLHRGHASLMKQSTAENDCTMASIFINPTQFNQTEDFIHYPRTLDDDLELLNQCSVDYCLIPHDQHMYADDFRFQIHDMSQPQRMEAQHRPGHFTGVLTIVMKLLTLVRPHRAYFGEKDYQQYQLIRDMVSAFL
jgi:pantoate--beta-alanine ligase